MAAAQLSHIDLAPPGKKRDDPGRPERERFPRRILRVHLFRGKPFSTCGIPVRSCHNGENAGSQLIEILGVAIEKDG